MIGCSVIRALPAIFSFSLSIWLAYSTCFRWLRFFLYRSPRAWEGGSYSLCAQGWRYWHQSHTKQVTMASRKKCKRLLLKVEFTVYIMGATSQNLAKTPGTNLLAMLYPVVLYFGFGYELCMNGQCGESSLWYDSHWLLKTDRFSFINSILMSEFLQFSDDSAQLNFEQVPFNHPLFIMYSSGTTGPPKCMVHSVGVSFWEFRIWRVNLCMTVNLAEEHNSATYTSSALLVGLPRQTNVSCPQARESFDQQHFNFALGWHSLKKKCVGPS